MHQRIASTASVAHDPKPTKAPSKSRSAVGLPQWYRRHFEKLLVNRREFITLLGGTAVAWPLTARAQQAPVPVIGYLSGESREVDASRLNGLRQGLNQAGYVEGRNFVIEYRWAENQADRLPVLVD